jgi:DNA polymerase-3 subunit epsilon
MLENEITLAAMAEALANSADYRVLRRLVPRKTFTPYIGQSTKTAVLLDVETTGLDQKKDEIIELGMVKFDYLPDGRIASLRDVFSSFNEPSDEPIPLEITALTGITNEMVAGQHIDEAAVSSFADDAVIVIAHNAGFDRKFDCHALLEILALELPTTGTPALARTITLARRRMLRTLPRSRHGRS